MAGVLHAGGVLRDAVLATQTAQGVFEVFAPKVSGAAQVLRHTGLQPGAGVQLFSSIAAAMGSGGQANYAAANATLDTWAHGCQAQARRPAPATAAMHSAECGASAPPA